uniref:DNA 3'-5' helicase n=1 Tax=Trichogramma kaykai TaxID=54128 RepID=A0ABD2W517_9HYME
MLCYNVNISDVTWRSNLIIIVKKFLCNKFNENNDAVGQYIIPRGSSLNRKQFHCLMRFLNNENVVNCSGIIYTYCKKSCYDLQLALQLNGVLTLSYTSEITHHSKKTKQEVWMNGQIKIMIATSAFGLGIDKPDTKFVVIYELPDSMDTLVQMIGRAGRNGEKAYGLIFYSFGDYQAIRGNMNRTLTLRRKNGSSTLENRVLKQSMLRDFFAQIIFLENMDKCRHGMIMNYYDHKAIPVMCSDKCDNCDIRRTDQLQLISNGYNMIADFVEQCNALKNAPTLTMNIAILLLTGEMCDSVEPAVAMLPAYGCFMMCRKSIVSYLLLQALERKIIDMDFVEDNSADYRDHIVLVKSYNMDHDQQLDAHVPVYVNTLSENDNFTSYARRIVRKFLWRLFVRESVARNIPLLQLRKRYNLNAISKEQPVTHQMMRGLANVSEFEYLPTFLLEGLDFIDYMNDYINNITVHSQRYFGQLEDFIMFERTRLTLGSNHSSQHEMKTIVKKALPENGLNTIKELLAAYLKVPTHPGRTRIMSKLQPLFKKLIKSFIDQFYRKLSNHETDKKTTNMTNNDRYFALRFVANYNFTNDELPTVVMLLRDHCKRFINRSINTILKMIRNKESIKFVPNEDLVTRNYLLQLEEAQYFHALNLGIRT